LNVKFSKINMLLDQDINSKDFEVIFSRMNVLLQFRGLRDSDSSIFQVMSRIQMFSFEFLTCSWEIEISLHLNATADLRSFKIVGCLI
jgi:hypothetical protein